jgi:hypothetical protein
VISLRGLSREVRDRAELALEWANYYRIPVTVTSAFRSLEHQRKLRGRFEVCVAEGRFPSSPGCEFPANRPGDSAHNFGLAWDSVTPPQYQWAWNYLREYAGFRVPENDEIHAEVPNWRGFVQ